MALLQLGDQLIIVFQVGFPGGVHAGGGPAEEFHGGDLGGAGHVQHELLIDLRQPAEGIGVVFQRIPGGQHLQAEGSPEPVFLKEGGADLHLLLLGAQGQRVAEIRHLQGGDVRLEDQLGDVRRSGGALLQLLPDMFQLGSAPVVLPLRFPAGKLPAGEAQYPGMVHADGALFLQVHGVVLRQAEVRIVQVFFQLRGRFDALGFVQHQQATETSGQQELRVQGLRQAVFLAPQHHEGQGPAVQAGPADRVGQLPPDGMAGLQAAQGFQVLLGQGRGKAVPGPGHVLRRHVDDPHGQPGFPVHGGQELSIRGKSGAQEGAPAQEGGGFAEVRGGIGVAVGREAEVIRLRCAPYALFLLFHGSLLKRVCQRDPVPMARFHGSLLKRVDRVWQR